MQSIMRAVVVAAAAEVPPPYYFEKESEIINIIALELINKHLKVCN